MESSKRETFTPTRDYALYLHYLRVIGGLGERARYMNKYDIYEEVARPFFVCPNVASRIITRMIKIKGVIREEFKSELLKDVDDVLKILDEPTQLHSKECTERK
jgi:hypothetical protein